LKLKEISVTFIFRICLNFRYIRSNQYQIKNIINHFSNLNIVFQPFLEETSIPVILKSNSDLNGPQKSVNLEYDFLIIDEFS
jgi:hypothetical protein